MTRHAPRPHPAPLDLTTAHPLQPSWDLQLGGLGADALHLALEHGLFDHLQQFKPATQLAQHLDWHADSTGYFLELLWSQGLLERDTQHPAHYRNRPLADRHLRSDGASYCGDALMFRHRVLRETGAQLDDYLRNGLPRRTPTSVQLDQAWANAARLQIGLLDLGGGPGLVAIALARQLPALSGTVFEYPQTAAVAACARLHAQGGDLDSDDIGRGYDLIWCSSVLHFVRDLPATLQRLHAALAPGGLLVC